MGDNTLRLWPRYDHVTGDMLFAPVFPRAPIPVYVSLDQIAGFIGDTGFSRITIGDAPPLSPNVGDAWWDSIGGQLYLWYDDGSSSQFVPASNQIDRTGVSVVYPSSGTTVTMGPSDYSLYVSTGALAALTIMLPPTPLPGDRVEICFAAPVDVLNLLTGAGSPISGAPANAFGPGAAIELRYIAPLLSWVPWK